VTAAWGIQKFQAVDKIGDYSFRIQFTTEEEKRQGIGYYSFRIQFTTEEEKRKVVGKPHCQRPSFQLVDGAGRPLPLALSISIHCALFVMTETQ
jgi:hypothetical protein